MNDFTSFEKTIVRELSCRLCLCNDVTKLKPLSSELKRKLKRLFDVNIKTDDTLPKAICHDCFQQVSNMHLYTVKVEKTQKFLEFHKLKSQDEKRDFHNSDGKLNPIQNMLEHHTVESTSVFPKPKTPPLEHQQGDTKLKSKHTKKKNILEMKYLEAMTLEEFAKTEKVDKTLLNTSEKLHIYDQIAEKRKSIAFNNDLTTDTLDSVVLIDGRPAKTGASLDRQITLFYKMECCICHENGFHFRSLMKHYKDRHGVPGYVTCCNKKFHYFYPKKIIEHMAYHLQPNIFMCTSCHHNFPTSEELIEHQANGGRSEGKVMCPRCSERFPTYHELGWHLLKHRTDRIQCDYCGKILKHHHRKKTINRMEDVILCSQCLRLMKNIEKQEKDTKEKTKSKDHDVLQKHQKFTQAMGLSGDEDASTE